MNILDHHIKRGSGIIAGPEGLGIFVGTDATNVPPGWIYINPIEPPGNTDEILFALRRGRKDWPKKL